MQLSLHSVADGAGMLVPVEILGLPFVPPPIYLPYGTPNLQVIYGLAFLPLAPLIHPERGLGWQTVAQDAGPLEVDGADLIHYIVRAFFFPLGYNNLGQNTESDPRNLRAPGHAQSAR